MNLTKEDFPNLLDSILFSSADVEAQISSFSLEFDSYKNDEVEWRMKLPMFVHSFYEYVIDTSSVPTQNQLWEKYSSQKEIKEKIIDPDIKRGIKARVFRTYPSLIRDIHFSLYLKENSKVTTEVIYNLALDVEYGVDILVVFNKNLFAVNLFTPTQRARMGRQKKEQRHKEITNVHQIELPVEFKTESKVGDFFLYREKELIVLRQIFKTKIASL